MNHPFSNPYSLFLFLARFARPAEAQAILDARAKEEEEKVAAEKANGPEAKEKRAKKIKKLLKQIAELKAKPELNDDQKKKVATEEALTKELSDLGL